MYCNLLANLVYYCHTISENPFLPKNATCLFCSNSLLSQEPKRGEHFRTKYCSRECAKNAHQKRSIAERKQCNVQSRLGLSGGAIGEINEVLVAVDLIKRGWNVYTAFEPTHPFDILAIKGDTHLRVEVKTETLLPSGNTIVAMKKGQRSKHDILARVQNLGLVITYDPPLS